MKKAAYLAAMLIFPVSIALAETIEEAKTKADVLNLADKTAVTVPVTAESGARTSDHYSRFEALFETGKQPSTYEIEGEWNRVAQITGPGSIPDYSLKYKNLLFSIARNPFAPNGYAIYLEKYDDRVPVTPNGNGGLAFTVNIATSYRFDYECHIVSKERLLLCRVNVKAHGDYAPNPWYEGYEKCKPADDDEDEVWEP